MSNDWFSVERRHHFFSPYEKRIGWKWRKKEKKKNSTRVTNCRVDRFRSNASITRGAKSLIDSVMARSWSPRYEKSLAPPSRVKFCRVNHNVTSIQPDRDWQSASTRAFNESPLSARCVRAERERARARGEPGCCWHPLVARAGTLYERSRV